MRGVSIVRHVGRRISLLLAILIMGSCAFAQEVHATDGAINADSASSLNGENNGRASAGTQERLAAFQSAAEALYLAVQNGEPLAVSHRLQDTEQALKDLPMSQIASAEGIEALSGNVSLLKRAVAAVSPDIEQIQHETASIRLAADALASGGQALWLRYQKLMKEDLAAIDASLNANTGQVTDIAKANYKQLSERYDLIRTAAALSREPSVIERADAVFRYTGRVMQAPKSDVSLVVSLLDPLRNAVFQLFPGGEESKPTVGLPVAPKIWGFYGAFGAFILSILTYSGWRRYHYEHTENPAPGRRGQGKRKPWIGR